MAEQWYSLTKDEVVQRLGTSEESGISDEEAARRLEEYGPNELVEKERISTLKIFLDQFKDLMVIILIIAAVISGAIATYQGTTEGWLDAAVIMIIVILNSIMGFVQEYKAEKTLKALKQLASPSTTVIRGGKDKDISSRELVPGDIIILSTGDKIPADARLIESVNLKVNEASLTGESGPISKQNDIVVEKDAFVGEKTNMVFSGCVVEYGRGKAVVTSTGMDTELGNIAHMIQTEPDQTPLQKKLLVLGKQLGITILGVSVFIFLVGLLRNIALEEMFLTSVSLAVAAIPEGLPAVVTISLALGLQRMAKRNSLVRKLHAVESLGSATVICTDKTGTLTKGEMNIREIYTGEDVQVSGEGFEPVGEFSVDGTKLDPLEVDGLSWLLKAGALCNDSSLQREKNKWSIKGDTTEGTLIVTARKAGIDHDELKAEYPRVFEVPFDSNKKRMTTVHEHDEKKIAFMKGAAETTVHLCDKMYIDGETVAMTDEDQKIVLEKDAEMARRALRVLAIAMRDVTDVTSFEDGVEKGFTFLGLVGMIDAPRKEAIEAIKKCKGAGIRVIMITGDHELTAKAIAKEMGIVETDEVPSISGRELEKISTEELARRVKEVRVFARVAPEHKVKIVEALKKNGDIVAMTGDGVNDAPALKKADIGIAMGITGTDVSKEAAGMVLADDNFASIVHGVEEGRGIYGNIRKFVSFLLSCNAGEVTTMFLAMFIMDPGLLPLLLPIQLLWMNLVTDGLPALSLGVEPTPPDVMERPPRDPTERPITRRMGYQIIAIGLLMALGTLLASYLEFSQTHDEVRTRTVAFCTLVMSQLLFVFSVRSERRLITQMGLRSNSKMLYAFVIALALQLMVVYVPFLNPVFKTVPIGIDEWIIILPISLSALVLNELWKVIRFREKKNESSTP
jgi:Ca2+-transporting ATPase